MNSPSELMELFGDLKEKASRRAVDDAKEVEDPGKRFLFHVMTAAATHRRQFVNKTHFLQGCALVYEWMDRLEASINSQKFDKGSDACREKDETLTQDIVATDENPPD